MRLARPGAPAQLLVALVSLLPFLRGLLTGQSFFYRDLARQFFPVRRFVVEGLRRGELRYWNPYVHEGEPLTLLPLGYPPDLLHAMLPDDRGFSLVLALHVPLSALAFMALARGLGLGAVAAAGGALIYALGGFCLSSLNLYVHLQAIGWAPLVVLGLIRAARGGSRECALAALVCAVALSTTGIEVAAQALLIGAVLSLSRPVRRTWARAGAAVVLGVGLAAFPLLVMMGLVTDSARGGGLATDMVLAYSIHPMTFLQVVIGGLYGDLTDYVNRFWGGLFFPGLPYFSSLYLGVVALALAAVGALVGGGLGLRLVLLAVAAALVSLGHRVGLAVLLEALPALRVFRFPTKAFFTVHLAVALLAALGLESLAQRSPWWRRLGISCLAPGVLLAAAPLLPRALPSAVHAFLSAFFPPAVPWPRRYEMGDLILRDAAVGGMVAVAAGLVGLLVAARRLPPARGAVVVVALLAADLLRTGAGLNPMVTPAFFELSPEMSQVAAALSADGGRVFTCDPLLSREYLQARLARFGRHEVWTPAVFMETLVPNFNMKVPLPSAYSQDVTGLVPLERVLPATIDACASLDALAERFRAAGIAHVISLDPLEHPALTLRAVVAPARIAPLSIKVYALRDPLPLRFVGSPEPAGRIASVREGADWIQMQVEADRSTTVVVRDAYAPGWRAWVNGGAAPVLRVDGRYRGVSVPPGASRVELRYRPPYLVPGLVLTVLSLGIAVTLWRWR